MRPHNVGSSDHRFPSVISNPHTTDLPPHRYPALDGLRGLAIIMVFAGHVAMFCSTAAERGNPVVNFLASNNGTGVDLFFVLSGFLITGILLDSKGSRFYFRRFFYRRTLRIFPLYYSVLAIVGLGCVAFPGLYALNTISDKAHLANWTYTTNLLMAARGWGAEPLFLGHFWSLAVEEQFYLVWPLVILLLSRKTLLRACIVGIIAALLMRVLLIRYSSYEAAYVLLPARMDALMIGGLIALLIREKDGPPGWMRSRVFVSGCVVLFTLDALFNESLFSGLPSIIRAASHFSITSVTFGALVLAAVTTRRDRLWLRLLKAPVKRFFGKYSYAIYIVHLAVIVALPKFMELTLGRLPGFPAAPGVIVNGMIALLISVGLALMTWRLIEKPALLLKERFPFYSTVLQSRAVPNDTLDSSSRTPVPQTE